MEYFISRGVIRNKPQEIARFIHGTNSFSKTKVRQYLQVSPKFFFSPSALFVLLIGRLARIFLIGLCCSDTVSREKKNNIDGFKSKIVSEFLKVPLILFNLSVLKTQYSEF